MPNVSVQQSSKQLRKPPELALPHLSHISRYWDRETNRFAARVLPGEHYVTRADETVCTVVGSCVSTCVRDTRRGVGGMNHFLLPHSTANDEGDADTTSTGKFRRSHAAMERLINDILMLGGRAQDIEITLVGGGHIAQGIPAELGTFNIELVRSYVQAEGLRIAGEDVGDVFPRRIQYFPSSGQITVKKLTAIHPSTVAERDTRLLSSLQQDAGQADPVLLSG